MQAVKFLLRSILLRKPITADEACAIAKRFADRKDLPWEEPVDVRVDFVGYWKVTTNAESLGGNLIVVLDPITGSVCRHEYVTE
jgi:hypothetical protein